MPRTATVRDVLLVCLLVLMSVICAGCVSAGANVWTPGSWPGGEVTILAIDPATPTTLYAGTYSGLRKSRDGGGSWGAVNTGLTDTQIIALAIDPATPTTLYVGTVHGGVFKSTDGGENWRATNLGLFNLDIPTLAIDPATPTTLYAGTSTGVYKSTDAGTSWKPGSWPGGRVFSLAIDPATRTTLYAGAFGGVFKSTDGGESWRAASRGLTSRNLDLVPYTPSPDALVIDPATPTTLYAGTSRGMYKSTDGGENWRATNRGLPHVDIDALAIDPATPTILYVSISDGVFKSVNGGRSWVNIGLTHTPVTALAIDPATPTTLYAGTMYTGVFKSAGGDGKR